MNNPQEKKEFLSELIRIMRIDGHESEQEKRMISATLDYLSISDVEFELLKKEYLDYVPPKEATHRIVHFYKMAILVKSDNVIQEKEELYLKELGLKMALRNEAVDAILKRCKELYSEELDPSEVIRIFQVFHN